MRSSFDKSEKIFEKRYAGLFFYRAFACGMKWVETQKTLHLKSRDDGPSIAALFPLPLQLIKYVVAPVKAPSPMHVLFFIPRHPDGGLNDKGVLRFVCDFDALSESVMCDEAVLVDERGEIKIDTGRLRGEALLLEEFWEGKLIDGVGFVYEGLDNSKIALNGMEKKGGKGVLHVDHALPHVCKEQEAGGRIRRRKGEVRGRRGVRS